MIPCPEFTPVYLASYQRGFRRTVNGVEYKEMSMYVTRTPIEWEIHRFGLKDGVPFDDATSGVLTLDEAKARVDWLARFCSMQYEGCFLTWCREHHIEAPWVPGSMP